MKRLILGLVVSLFLTGCTNNSLLSELQKSSPSEETKQTEPVSTPSLQLLPGTQQGMIMPEDNPAYEKPDTRIFLDQDTNIWIKGQYGDKQLTKNAGTTNGCKDGRKLNYAKPVLSDESKYAVMTVICEGEEAEIFIKDTESLKALFLRKGQEASFKNGNKTVVVDNSIEVENPFLTEAKKPYDKAQFNTDVDYLVKHEVIGPLDESLLRYAYDNRGSDEQEDIQAVVRSILERKGLSADMITGLLLLAEDSDNKEAFSLALSANKVEGAERRVIMEVLFGE